MPKLAIASCLLVLFAAIVLIAGGINESRMRGVDYYPPHSDERTQKQMTPEEMKQLMLRLKELGLDSNQLPQDPIQLEQLSNQLSVESVHWEASPGGSATGMQQIALTPSAENSETGLELLPTYLEGPEWTAIFHDQLHRSYVDDPGPIEEWRAKQEEYFRGSLPDFPMIARIWDTYIDVQYKATEVSQLRAECIALLNQSTHSKARSGLQKLIDASDMAISKGMGLSLLAD